MSNISKVKKTKNELDNTIINNQEKSYTENISRILDKYNNERGQLIAILQEIQREYGYLPEKVLKMVSDITGWALVDIYGLATFYSSFSLKSRGKHLVCGCLGTACHVRGASNVVKEFERQLGIKVNQTTADKKFTLETVNCLGACALGPVVVIDGHYFSKVNKSKVGPMINQALQGFKENRKESNEQLFPDEVRCPHCNHLLTDGTSESNGKPAIKVKVSFEQKDYWLTISQLNGTLHISSDLQISPDKILDFLCPHCHLNFPATLYCTQCLAPMVSMLIENGSMLQICSRVGCKNYMLDLS